MLFKTIEGINYVERCSAQSKRHVRASIIKNCSSPSWHLLWDFSKTTEYRGEAIALLISQPVYTHGNLRNKPDSRCDNFYKLTY
jgi:hypothetical protein